MEIGYVSFLMDLTNMSALLSFANATIAKHVSQQDSLDTDILST